MLLWFSGHQTFCQNMKKSHFKGRRSAMARAVILPWSLETLSTSSFFLIVVQKASKPWKWHWLSLPPIGALIYVLWKVDPFGKSLHPLLIRNEYCVTYLRIFGTMYQYMVWCNKVWILGEIKTDIWLKNKADYLLRR